MVSRFLQRTILSVTAATILISQQILTKTVIVQAQETVQPPYPPLLRSRWVAYNLKPEALYTFFPDGISACQAYKNREPGTSLEKIVAYSTPSGEIKGATCYLKSSSGISFQLQTDVECPFAAYPNGYIYSGGTNGLCISSPIVDKVKNEGLTKNENTLDDPIYIDIPQVGVRTVPLSIIRDALTPTPIGKELPLTPALPAAITNNIITPQKETENKNIAENIANGHAYDKHKGEFPEVKNRQGFKETIERVLNNPRTKVKKLINDRIGYYDETTNTLVVRNPKAPDGGTAFRPIDGIDYFNNWLR